MSNDPPISDNDELGFPVMAKLSESLSIKFSFINIF